MYKVIKDVDEALVKWGPDNEFWDRAHLNCTSIKHLMIEQFYKHYEWPGCEWMFTYVVTPRCAGELLFLGYVERNQKQRHLFTLTKKGEERRALLL